jgi:hypothetical protein
VRLELLNDATRLINLLTGTFPRPTSFKIGDFRSEWEGTEDLVEVLVGQEEISGWCLLRENHLLHLDTKSTNHGSNASNLKYKGDGKDIFKRCIGFGVGSAIADKGQVEGEEGEGGGKWDGGYGSTSLIRRFQLLMKGRNFWEVGSDRKRVENVQTLGEKSE